MKEYTTPFTPIGQAYPIPTGADQIFFGSFGSVSGNVSLLIPSPRGPRHCGQFSPDTATAPANTAITPNNRTGKRMLNSSFPDSYKLPAMDSWLFADPK